MILKIVLIGFIVVLGFSIIAGIIGMIMGDLDEERKNND